MLLAHFGCKGLIHFQCYSIKNSKLKVCVCVLITAEFTSFQSKVNHKILLITLNKRFKAVFNATFNATLLTHCDNKLVKPHASFKFPLFHKDQPRASSAVCT